MTAVKTLSEPADIAAEDEPVARQTNVLATPRVHVFGSVAAAEAFAMAKMPALSVLQGQRTRVEIQPEVVWYAGAEPTSVNAELKLFLINADGVRVPSGEEIGSIAGRVTAELRPGETEPSPLAGMRVVAIGQGIPDWGGADTGPDGSYRIDDLPSGSYKVYARDPQRLGITEFYNHVLDVQEATPVAVRQGQTTSGIDFSLPPRPTGPTGAIAGRVMVANQAGVVRKPLDTLTVWAEPVHPSGRPWRRYGLTDGSGNYRIELLEPGTYLLHVVDPPGLFATQYFDHVPTPEEATPVVVTGEHWRVSLLKPLRRAAMSCLT